jgi:hypothetical protein
MFMTTHEDCVARSWEFDPSGKEIKMIDVFPGHSNTVRYRFFILINTIGTLIFHQVKRDS